MIWDDFHCEETELNDDVASSQDENENSRYFSESKISFILFWLFQVGKQIYVAIHSKVSSGNCYKKKKIFDIVESFVLLEKFNVKYFCLMTTTIFN